MKKEQSFSVFLPVRKGSQRVKNKNTRPFASFPNGLLELKLSQLINVDSICEIIVSTNDPECENIGREFSQLSKKVIVDKRPEHLGTDKTSLVDLVKYIPGLTQCHQIIWTHVTSPFFETSDYEKAIVDYEKAILQGFDSLMGVMPFKNFLWSKENNDIINRTNDEKWPRTQDLKELFEIDSSVFIASKRVYIENDDRLGSKPFLFINDKIKSFDIDWEDDFFIAEAIYSQLKAKNRKLGNL